MTKPVRLQLSRAKGFNLQEHSRAVNGLKAVNVARPSKWGNPYKVGGPAYVSDKSGRTRLRRAPLTANEAVDLYRKRECKPMDSAAIAKLRGKNLACWCALDAPCHADVLLELANRPICETCTHEHPALMQAFLTSEEA